MGALFSSASCCLPLPGRQAPSPSERGGNEDGEASGEEARETFSVALSFPSAFVGGGGGERGGGWEGMDDKSTSIGMAASVTAEKKGLHFEAATRGSSRIAFRNNCAMHPSVHAVAVDIRGGESAGKGCVIERVVLEEGATVAASSLVSAFETSKKDEEEEQGRGVCGQGGRGGQALPCGYRDNSPKLGHHQVPVASRTSASVYPSPIINTR